MARQAILVQKDKKKRHVFVLIEHKRGVARVCVRCGDLRYYGKHRVFKANDFDEGIMIVVPVSERDSHHGDL